MQPQQEQPAQAIINAIDVKLQGEVKSKGVAYFRLDDAMYEFMQKCQTKDGVIGFEWDGTRNFGIILGE